MIQNSNLTTNSVYTTVMVLLGYEPICSQILSLIGSSNTVSYSDLKNLQEAQLISIKRYCIT